MPKVEASSLSPLIHCPIRLAMANAARRLGELAFLRLYSRFRTNGWATLTTAEEVRVFRGMPHTREIWLSHEKPGSPICKSRKSSGLGKRCSKSDFRHGTDGWSNGRARPSTFPRSRSPCARVPHSLRLGWSEVRCNGRVRCDRRELERLVRRWR